MSRIYRIPWVGGLVYTFYTLLVAVEKARVGHLSPRGHLDGIVVNPFVGSCLVDGTQVDSLVSPSRRCNS